MKQRDEEFAEYFDARVVSMRRTAYLLCGDWHRAEDLVQTALTKIYVAWPRINRGGTVDAYARQVLVRSAIDESRRGFRKRETALPEVPEHGTPAHDVGETVDLRNALAALPPGQRAAVVLRYWEDQSVEATAQLLGCSTGTVKSQTARGLAALRKLLGSAQPATGGVPMNWDDEEIRDMLNRAVGPEPELDIRREEIVRQGRRKLRARWAVTVAGLSTVVGGVVFGAAAFAGGAGTQDIEPARQGFEQPPPASTPAPVPPPPSLPAPQPPASSVPVPQPPESSVPVPPPDAVPVPVPPPGMVPVPPPGAEPAPVPGAEPSFPVEPPQSFPAEPPSSPAPSRP